MTDSLSPNQGSAQILKRIAGYLPGTRRAIVLALLALMGVAATAPLFAALMEPLLDGGLSGERPEYVWMIPVAIVAIFMLRGILTFCSAYLLSWAMSRMLASLRQQLFDRVLHLPDQTIRRLGSAQLINRFVLECSMVMQLASEVITVLVRDSLVVLALLILLLYLSWPLTLVALVLIPLAAWVTRGFISRLRRINQETVAMNAELTRRVSEAVDGQRVIKLFDAYARESSRFDQVNMRLRRFAIRNTAASAAVVPLTQFIASIALAIVVAIAIAQSGQQSLTVGGFAAFITAMLQLLQPLKHLANIAGPLQRMRVAAETVFGVLDEAPEDDSGQAVLPQPVRGEIRYEAVSHRYPGAERDSLRGIDLLLPAGKTVAVVGRSGGGKTTLLSLLARFEKPTQGRVLLDGVDIAKLSLRSLRAQIALVSQDVVLFDGTLRENVAFGVPEPVSDERIRAALADANLLEFVDSQPEGLDLAIGENGSRLSGGQRQRLAIARALIKQAPILLLDEATSALDNESERLVQASLDRLMAGRTTLVIAHRLSTIQSADLIVVMDEGRVVEQGTHAELIASNGVYAILHKLQFAA